MGNSTLLCLLCFAIWMGWRELFHCFHLCTSPGPPCEVGPGTADLKSSALVHRMPAYVWLFLRLSIPHLPVTASCSLTWTRLHSRVSPQTRKCSNRCIASLTLTIRWIHSQKVPFIEHLTSKLFKENSKKIWRPLCSKKGNLHFFLPGQKCVKGTIIF